MEKRNTALKRNSQQLRKDMTPQERKLWYVFLKSLPQHFYRQRIIGNYIVDFYCPSAKLIIELDGSQHYEADGKLKDAERDNYMSSLGIMVLRYSNRDINERFKSVCEDIYNHLSV